MQFLPIWILLIAPNLVWLSITEEAYGPAVKRVAFTVSFEPKGFPVTTDKALAHGEGPIEAPLSEPLLANTCAVF